ncbi:hypothetical protein [uncultured Bifidobacterium sp.]|uniref:hypothetical protein n=1 Tax=uncultured Bifidobacterium sp. TaxID=165187 RepID=UPI0026057B32|nr:hypothetical protein [uncultured Bifidobacterium sp.]
MSIEKMKRALQSETFSTALWVAVMPIGALIVMAAVYALFKLPKEGDESGWIMWGFGAVSVGFCAVFMAVFLICRLHGRWESAAAMVPSFLHLAYLLLLAVMLAVASWLDRPNKASLFCLMLFSAAELFAVSLYCFDALKGRCGPAGDRWWSRTVLYPVAGLAFVFGFGPVKQGFGVPGETMWSVGFALLVTGYVLQVYNERFMPREGPYKMTHGAPGDDRLGSGEGAC